MSLVNAALHSLGIDPGTHGPLGGKKIKNVLLERLPETTCLLSNQLLNYKKSRAPPRPNFYSRRPPGRTHESFGGRLTNRLPDGPKKGPTNGHTNGPTNGPMNGNKNRPTNGNFGNCTKVHQPTSFKRLDNKRFC